MNMKRLIILILIVLIIYLVINVSKEPMTLPSNILIVDEKAIVNALQHTSYLNDLNASDIKTRKLPSDSNTLIEHYVKHMITPSPFQKKMLDDMIKTIYIELKVTDRKAFIRETWKFAIFYGIENNFPHTHKDIIFMPTGLIHMERNNRMTLIHEKVHIHQKRIPLLYEDLYTNYWHFKRIDNSFLDKLPFKLRSNPDVLDNNWLFTYNGANIVMLVKYRSSSMSITDVDYIGYNIDTGEYKALKDIPQYTEFFGKFNINYYHPYEIVADMIAYHCYGMVRPTKSYNRFLSWWKKIE